MVKKQLIDLFRIDCKEEVFVIFTGDFHFQASTLSSAEEQLCLCNVIERYISLSDLNGVLLNLQKLLDPYVGSLL